MKRTILSALFIIFLSIASLCQSADLPNNTTIPHLKLSVGYNVTTVLIFPSPILQADRGERDLLIQKQSGIENVLKVKAARKSFPATNLHVFTADGHVYAFDVIYTATPDRTSYDLSGFKRKDSSDTNDPVKFSIKPIDKSQILENVAKVKNAKPFFSFYSHKNKMDIKLQTIYQCDDILYFGFKISNESTLPFNVDFVKIYFQEKRKIKRSSVQELDVAAIYKDTLSTVSGKSTQSWVIALRQYTVPEHRLLMLELTEKNGGRTLQLPIKNAQLLRSRSLK